MSWRIIRGLFRIDELLHILVAVALIVISVCLLGHAVVQFVAHPAIHGLLRAVNVVLMVLIVLELLWPVLTFLKRDPFSLNPFIYVCIMSSIRRILLVEAEMSIGRYDHHAYLLEVGVSVGTIFVMILVHYIYNKGRLLEKQVHEGRQKTGGVDA